MIRTLTFSATSHPIKLPAMAEGFGNGISINIWVRRTGSGGRQRIVDLGTAAGVHLVLGTGDQDDSLALGIENGTERRELVCEGALPLNRWVKVSALATSMGIAKLSVFDIDLEQGLIGSMNPGPFTDCSIAGGAAGRPFLGSLSGLEIYQLPPPSWFGGGPPSVLWGKYPLSGLTYLKTIDTASGPVKCYSVDDQSAGNHDGVVEGGLAVSQFAELGYGTLPVLEMDGIGKTLFLSPVQGLAGKLTLETWFNPASTQTQQSMIILADDKNVSLVVTVGGNSPNGGGNLEVLLCKGTEKVSLLYTAYGENAGVFQHLAVTFAQADSVGFGPIVMSLYLNGQFVTSRTVTFNLFFPQSSSSGQQYWPLIALLKSPSIPNVRLGGTIAGFAKFKGQLSEFRIWNSCRTASEISSRFLSRLVGNEPGLLACYRLEQSVTGCVFDISEQRGLGTLQTGSTIGPASNLPLLHTSNPNAAHLRVKGKLLREYIVYTTQVIILSAQPSLGPDGTITITPTVKLIPHAEQVTVFDATLEPIAPDGTLQSGKTIQICPDRDVQVFLEQDNNSCQLTTWTAKQTYSVTVPTAGKLRLRFKASSLTFPTLRARYSDMTGGLWTAVRPDSQALVALANTNGASLLTPPQGKPSPLPSGTTTQDAHLCADTLVRMGRCYRPIAYSETQLVGEARSILGSIENTWNDVTDWTEGAVSTASSTLQKAGAGCGKWAEALVDDGKTLLSQAESLTKTASSLLSTAAGDLTELVNATANAVPRFGKDQIAQCIASADRLAVISSAAANVISHTFSIIGTTIIDGVTYAWRVVANGVLDAFAATVEFLKKIGASIMQMLEYLAWLFNWTDFLKASDRIYSTVETELANAKSLITGLSQYKATLNQYLTLPAGVGQKSLAELCGINIPDNLGAEELDYVLELAQKVMGATSLKLDCADQFTQNVSLATPGLDVNKLQSIASSLSGSTSSSVVNSPLLLLNTPVQNLLNGMVTGSAQTTVVDFLFELLTAVSDTMISSGTSILTSRLNVPSMTGWIEDTILGGRKLSLLRIVALAAGIAQVLASKIAASAKSGSASPQPVSFAGSTVDTGLVWANLSLSILLTILQIPRAAIDLVESKAGSDAALEAAERASSIPMALWDTAIALTCLARSAINYAANARLPEDIQAALGMMTAMESLAGANLLVVTWTKAFFWNNSAFGKNWVKAAKIFDCLVQFALACGSMVTSVVAAITPNAFTSALDWTAFGLQAGSYVTNQCSLLTTSYIDLNPTGKLSPYVPVGLSAATAMLDLGTSITSVVQNT